MLIKLVPPTKSKEKATVLRNSTTKALGAIRNLLLREYLKKEEDRLSIISMGEGEERVVCKSCSLEAEAVTGLFHVISKRRREEGTWSSHGHILSGEG